MGIDDVVRHLRERGWNVHDGSRIAPEGMPYCLVDFGGLHLTAAGPKTTARIILVAADLDDTWPSQAVEAAAGRLWADLRSLRSWLPRRAGPVELLDETATGIGRVLFGCVVTVSEVEP